MSAYMHNSFRSRMRQLFIVSAAGVILIGIVALFCEAYLKRTADFAQITSTALHNHTEADMMHDALHSDVLSALLVASGAISTNRAEIEESLHEHSAWFRRALEANENLQLPDDVKTTIRDVKPALDSYIKSAEELVNLAFSDVTKAKAKLPQFEESFEALEKKNSAVSDKIQSLQEESAGALTRATHLSQLLTLIIVATSLGVTIYFSSNILKTLSAQLGGEPEYAIEAVRKVAAGDLMTQVHTRSGDNSSLLYAIAQMQQALAQIIDHTQKKLVSNVAQLLSTTDAARNRISQQATETDHVMAATRDMATSIEEVAHSAEQAASASQGAKREAESGRSVINSAINANRELSAHMENAAEVIRRLNDGTEQIGTFLNVIRTIAEQTNLLALNAAIEAARAGEQGRGFAVVADEVRTLAQRTQQSTKEIQDIINSLEQSTREAVNVIQVGRGLSEQTLEQVGNAGGSLEAITSAVDIIDSMNAQIAAAVEQQSHVAREISSKLDSVSQLATSANSAAEQSIGASRQVDVVVGELKQLLAGRFNQ